MRSGQSGRAGACHGSTHSAPCSWGVRPAPVQVRHGRSCGAGQVSGLSFVLNHTFGVDARSLQALQKKQGALWPPASTLWQGWSRGAGATE